MIDIYIKRMNLFFKIMNSHTPHLFLITSSIFLKFINKSSQTPNRHRKIKNTHIMSVNKYLELYE